MLRPGLFALIAGLLILSGGSIAQEKKAKDDPKKDEPATKVKGTLPRNWGKLGLSETQVQEIYRIQNKYDAEIDKLEAKINELKAGRTKDTKAVLTADQKKRLDEILTGKDK